MGRSKGGGKQWQPTHKNAVCQSHTGRLTGLWFLPKPAFGLNTNDDDILIFKFLDSTLVDKKFCTEW